MIIGMPKVEVPIVDILSILACKIWKIR